MNCDAPPEIDLDPILEYRQIAGPRKPEPLIRWGRLVLFVLFWGAVVFWFWFRLPPPHDLNTGLPL